MRRHVCQLKGTIGERRHEWLGPEMKGDTTELIKAFVVCRRTNPAFTDQQHICFHHRKRLLLSIMEDVPRVVHQQSANDVVPKTVTSQARYEMPKNISV